MSDTQASDGHQPPVSSGQQGADAPRSPEQSSAPRGFRWQALFQQVDEPLFVLNRKRAVLFVNQAWEKLTGLSAAEARQVSCRRHRPVTVHDSPQDVLAHLLCPPVEVLQGESARSRRLLPGRGPTPRWWDVEFLPLRQHGKVLGILGRILPLPSESSSPLPPLPEKLLALRQQAVQRQELEFLTSDLPALRRLAEQVRLASQVPTSVVLAGEAGTGKQTLARIIHARSAGRERSFATLDCTRLPPEAVATLLLADQGADQRLALGTVYLKEPGRLPRELQQRLLELLTAAGESLPAEEGPAMPRLLAGFRGDPLEQVRSGRLLAGLFYALDTLHLEVPPLRERLADLPWLVERCLARANSEGEVYITGLTPDAWEILRAHPWPGNLRELYDVLAGARRHATTHEISAADLPAALRLRQSLGQTLGRAAEQPLPLDQVLEQVERRLILLTLQRTRGNKAKAAELLDVLRSRLLRRMRVLKIADPSPESDEGQADAPSSGADLRE